MEAKHHDWTRTVFRLRALPHELECLDDVASLLGNRLDDTPAHSIRVFSLATALRAGESNQDKVATVMFERIPSLVRESASASEWLVQGEPGSELTLDTHFLGMTPLNDVEPLKHTSDCVAISGLASHPFGSWQPKLGDKTFMWIRDELPNILKSTRAIIYGYDTKLDDSQSFQPIPDLAKAFISQLETYHWSTSFAKPTAFIAHSLGGLILKEALVQLAQIQDEVYRGLLHIIKGVVFLGVPNLSMEQNHFQTIARDNPNQHLLDDIARGSNYLQQLHKAFEDNCFMDKMRCYWAYETTVSPTVRIYTIHFLRLLLTPFRDYQTYVCVFCGELVCWFGIQSAEDVARKGKEELWVRTRSLYCSR